MLQKRQFLSPPTPPPTPSLHVFFHQGGPALFQCRQRVIYRWRPTSSCLPQIALLFLTSRLCESVISLIFSALRDTTSPPTPPPPPSPTPPPPPCRFYIIARLLSSCRVCLLCPSNPPPLLSSEPPRDFFLAVVTLSLISLLSPSSFPLLLILVALCHACSCIISFDNLYTERRACACVCVCVRACVCVS